MKTLTAENKLVIALFIMVLVTFSFAHKDSKKLEQLYVHIGENVEMLSSVPQRITEKEIKQTSYFAKSALPK